MKTPTVTAQIKAALKIAYPTIIFSVKKGTGGLNTKYTIAYTDGPCEALVQALTKKYEDIRYCKASGDMLDGCNTFVDTDRILTDKAKNVYRNVMETLGFTDHKPMCNVQQYRYNKTLKAVMESTILEG